MIPTERSKDFWKRAGAYPADKESVYPDHAIAQELDKHTGKCVLEYGCGGGSDAMSYLRRGCYVTFVDIVPENVDATKARIGDQWPGKWDGLALHASDIIHVEYDSYDVASSHGVLHHIEYPLPVLRELWRVLKPGGMLYVMLYTEVLRKSFEVQIAEHREKHGISEEEAFGWCTDEQGCPYARAYTPDEGWELLREAGFDRFNSFTYEKDIFRTFRAVKP